METLRPDYIEWIPYDNLKNIKFLTKGGCSEIYTAVWIDGSYEEWVSKEKQLKRYGEQNVVLKKLENVENANRSWFDEGKSHLYISKKYSQVVPCYENVIHGDLHSGNILFGTISQLFKLSDFGFCGPADKPLNSIYGNLPYIAPEVICGKETTFASDIYSIGMLMWEISSGQSPFINFENDCELALKIINGMRPKIVSGTPLEYKDLMEQCWDADPTKRPDIYTLKDKIRVMNRLNYQNELKKNKSIVKKLIEKIRLSKPKANTISKISEINNFKNSNTSSRLFTSKVYQFKNLPEPKNATEEEQEAFHSKTYNYNIPYNIDDFINKNNDNASKSINIIEDDNKELSEVTENMQINYSNSNNVQNDYKKEIIQQVKKHNIDYIDDENEIYNNPNLHSEEQDELEIPDDGF
ncbi:kinase-like protein [Rhizophagus irregularis]|uniref:Kinase-like protein n=1 Tax=Rhizophagus irregularis TaxID=588596 RepID=A0A2I1GGL4_9GLOM|nr:kinase-like protein [Rhizophagus irregularis]